MERKYHEHIDYEGFQGFVSLFTDGMSCYVEFTHKDGSKQKLSWYTEQSSGGAPWIPKRRNFISLVKQMIREGDLQE